MAWIMRIQLPHRENVEKAVIRVQTRRASILVVDPVGGATLQSRSPIADIAAASRWVGRPGREQRTIDVLLVDGG